ncbi:MAG: 4Fe-4S dicluster domain-containing protein, partial [Ectothiorhodospira sp.]
MKPCPENRDPREVLQDTDLCVKCGLCLPHCPTYRATRDEGDSPRGRITLMQGLMAGHL